MTGCLSEMVVATRRASVKYWRNMEILLGLLILLICLILACILETEVEIVEDEEEQDK